MLRERRRHANFKPNRKLDQKSSRGMIYENEELRLRTININAEVERGQSDIKKLRRENDLLRKEIWSLRDEYDRLDKLLRKNHHRQCNTNGTDKCDNCCNQSDGSNSCDTCNNNNDDDDEDDDDDDVDDDDDDEDEDVVDDDENNEYYKKMPQQESFQSENGGVVSCMKQQSREKLHVNFDHLSIVSEENFTNSSDDTSNQCDIKNNEHEPVIAMSSPIADALHDFQSSIPPLAHFENLCYEDIGPSIDSSGEVRYGGSDSRSTTAETVIPSKEWDFNNKIVTSHESLSTQLQQQPSISPILSEHHQQSLNKFGPPDFCLNNAMATTASTRPSNIKIEPIYAQIDKNYSSRQCQSPSVFQTGGNLDDLLSDIELLSKDIIDMQYENKKKYHSQYHLNQSLSLINNDNVYENIDDIYQMKKKNDKMPLYHHRSEMNLLLSFDGDTQKITTIPLTTTSTIVDEKLCADATTVNETTPPPQLPQPMPLLPSTLPYTSDLKSLSDDNDNNNLSSSLQQLTSNTNAVTTLTPSSTSITQRSLTALRRQLFAKRLPANNSLATTTTTTATTTTCTTSTITESMSHDVTPITTAAITSTTPITKSIDSTAMDIKRKSRRVSIYFNGKKQNDVEKQQRNSLATVSINESMANGDESTIKNVDDTTTTNTLTNSISNSNNLLKKNHHNHHHHHHHSHRKLSQDSLRGVGQTTSALTDTKTLLPISSTTSLSIVRGSSSSGGGGGSSSIGGGIKNRRRHSDGTVLLRGTSSSTNGTNNFLELPHGTGGGATILDRNSNNLTAISRESSTSLSNRSQSKSRKISIGSHTAGNIPWCACWGNGCL